MSERDQTSRWRCCVTGCNPVLIGATDANRHREVTGHRIAKWPIRSATGKAKAALRNKTGYYDKYNVGDKADSDHIAAFDPPTVIQLLDQIDILSRNVELTRHQRGEQQARATTAEATIARVRELHNKTYVSVENQVWGRDPRCSECHDAYPCPTIQALDGSAS